MANFKSLHIFPLVMGCMGGGVLGKLEPNYAPGGETSWVSETQFSKSPHILAVKGSALHCISKSKHNTRGAKAASSSSGACSSESLGRNK